VIGSGADPEASDISLVVGVMRRDREALRKIYQRYGGDLYGLARRVCGPDLAEEVLQEVFLELWRSPERFDCTRGPLPTFLAVQVYGRAAQAGVTGTAGDEVWRLLRALPDDERHAIALANLDRHNYRDVASVLGHPEGTVKRRIRSGLAALRLQLSAAADPSRVSLP